MLKNRPSVLAKVPVEVPVDAGAVDVFDEVLDVLDVVVGLDTLELPDVTNPILKVCSVEGREETTDVALVVVVNTVDDVVFTDVELVELVAVAEAVPGTHCP